MSEKQPDYLRHKISANQVHGSGVWDTYLQRFCLGSSMKDAYALDYSQNSLSVLHDI